MKKWCPSNSGTNYAINKISKTTKKETISLEVNEKNTIAIKLYEKFGFEKVGLRKKYYNEKDNAIIMTKILI